MLPYQKGIQFLKSINLLSADYDHILAGIARLASIGFIKIELPAGMTIMRGRPDEGPFSWRKQLSYKPQEFNTTYQRASTPFNTMFYGTVVTKEEMLNKPLSFPRLITALEASSLLRDGIDGSQPINYSRWEITQPIPVLVIAPHGDKLSNNPNTEQLRSFLEEFAGSPEVDSQMTIEITNYLAEIFSKGVLSTDPHEEYKISAIATEFFLSQSKGKVEGIYYPSVRAAGGGYVVALTPNVVDSSLKLVAAGRCRIYKKGNTITVDNELACLIHDDSNEFQMELVSNDNRSTRESIESLGFTRWEH